MTPYTYFLMWKNTGHKYYGCQYGKTADPANILTKSYRTSSKYVAQHWEVYGDPDIIVIHRTFMTAKECREFEHWYLTRVNAVRKSDWLNRTNNKAICTDNYNPISWKKSHESRKRHFDADPEFRKNLADRASANMNTDMAMTKRKESFEQTKHSQGANNPRYGIVMSDELKSKISAARKQQVALNIENATRLNAKRFTCEHCDKSDLSVGNYKRWHHDNCSRK